jgi:PAS domain S-box-containing protein
MALALPILTFLILHLIGPTFSDPATALVLILGIVLPAYCGGMKPGGLATLLSAGVFAYFLRDGADVASTGATDLPALTVLLFIAAGAGISWLCHMLHEAQEQAQLDKRRLQSEILERKNTERVFRETAARFRVLLGCIDDHAIFALDDRGRVTAWNFGAESVTGYPSDEVTGKRFSFLYAEADPEEKATRDLRAAEDATWQHETWCTRKDGSKFWAAVTLAQLRSEDGRRRGFACVIRDLTPARLASQALRETEARLELAVQVAGIVMIEVLYNQEGVGVVRGGSEYAAFLGLPPGPVELPFVEIQGAIHPNDRVATLKSLADAIDPTGTGSASIEYHMVRFDGQLRRVSSRAQTFFAPIDGRRRPVKTVLALLDITDRAETEVNRTESTPMTVA